MTGSRLLSGSGFMMSLALGCFLFVGCSQTPGSHKQRTDVNVTITENGAPLTEGVVNLVNEETGEGGGGTLNSEGVATISGVALGSYTLIVLPPDESVIPSRTGPAGSRSEGVPEYSPEIP